MIAAWMLSLFALGATLLVAAFAADAVCARLDRPRRWVWAGAMLAMCIVPFVPRPELPLLRFATVSAAPDALSAGRDGASRPIAAGPRATDAVAVSADGSPMPLGDTRMVRRTPRTPRPLVVTSEGGGAGNHFVVTSDSPLVRLDRALAGTWATLSLVLLALVLVATGRLARERRGWRRADPAMHAAVAREAGRAVPTWRSATLGPAAFGLRTAQVVIPDWVDELPDAERALLLAHEASHVRTRDPQLLAAALALVVLLPWHLPLLVAYRRLCRAVELDCDARVLTRHGDARGYGRLLVRTAEWLLAHRSSWRGSVAARWIFAPVPAFAAPASELESRLRALVPRRGTWRARLGAAVAGSAALLALVVACAVPSPTKGTMGMPDGTRALAPALRDSLRLYERINSVAMQQRMAAVTDSLLDVAIRNALPQLDTLAGADSLNGWVVVDHEYRPVLAQVAPRWRYTWKMERVGPGFGMPKMSVASATTPREALAVDVRSWARAFPLLDPERVKEHGHHEVRTARGTIAVAYARLWPGDTTSGMVSRAAGTPARIPDWFRTVALAMATDSTIPRATFSRALDTGLRENLRWRVPEVLEDTATADAYVWLLLGPTGDAVAHGLGRNGLAVTDPGTLTADDAPRATATTPHRLLSLDETAWTTRFPTLGAPPVAFGMTSLPVGQRTVHVLWGLQDLALVTGSAVASGGAGSPQAALRARDVRIVPPIVVATRQLFPDTLGAAARAWRFRALREAHDRSSGADTRLAMLLRAAIAEARPEVLRGRRGDEHFVWLVFDSTARVIAADTGRAGLGVETTEWRAAFGTPRATARTARDSLVLDGDAFRAKFGAAVRRGREYTWQGIELPNGSINVIWTVAARD